MNWHYLYIFAQVNALELAVLAFWFRGALPFKTILFATILANAVTHPIVFFARASLGLSHLEGIAIAEVFAPTVEALIYVFFFDLNKRTAWTGSILANLISWQLGPVLTALVFLQHRL